MANAMNYTWSLNHSYVYRYLYNLTPVGILILNPERDVILAKKVFTIVNCNASEDLIIKFLKMLRYFIQFRTWISIFELSVAL